MAEAGNEQLRGGGRSKAAWSSIKLVTLMVIAIFVGIQVWIAYPGMGSIIMVGIAIIIGLVLISLIKSTGPIETAPARGAIDGEIDPPVPLPLARLRMLEPDKLVQALVDLFENMGFDVPEDSEPVEEGIDYFIAVNPEPIKGGRFVVECFPRPPGNLVDSPRVLALMDNVKAEGAAKGIYCTPFLFSEEARTAARTGPVELLDGAELVKLFQKRLPDRLVER